MSHPDEEQLAGLASGEQVSSDVTAHLEDCAACRARLARTHDVLTALGEPVELVAPAPDVWDRVVAELDQPVAPRRRVPAALVAAAGAAVGVAATVAVELATREEPAPAPTPPAVETVAVGRVEPLPADDGSMRGTARVLRERDGRELRVVLDHRPRHGRSFVQAWMLDPTTKQMVAVGVVDRRVTTFPIPAGMDLRAYSAVDLSLEPPDGDPAHSQTSLARAQLRRR